jgi:DnaA family protein
MKQIALDIGLAAAPSFINFFAGPNEAALKHLQLWAGSPTRSPVPTYLWGASGSGKTHLLKATQ